MWNLPDLVEFPSTPEEMRYMLLIEAEAKRTHGLTERGLSGHIAVYFYSMAGFAVIDTDKVEVRHAS